MVRLESVPGPWVEVRETTSMRVCGGLFWCVQTVRSGFAALAMAFRRSGRARAVV